jgi:hypothetical protein
MRRVGNGHDGDKHDATDGGVGSWIERYTAAEN